MSITFFFLSFLPLVVFSPFDLLRILSISSLSRSAPLSLIYFLRSEVASLSCLLVSCFSFCLWALIALWNFLFSSFCFFSSKVAIFYCCWRNLLLTFLMCSSVFNISARKSSGLEIGQLDWTKTLMPSMTFWRVTLKIASSLLISSWTAASWLGI